MQYKISQITVITKPDTPPNHKTMILLLLTILKDIKEDSFNTLAVNCVI